MVLTGWIPSRETLEPQDFGTQGALVAGIKGKMSVHSAGMEDGPRCFPPRRCKNFVPRSENTVRL